LTLLLAMRQNLLVKRKTNKAILKKVRIAILIKVNKKINMQENRDPQLNNDELLQSKTQEVGILTAENKAEKVEEELSPEIIETIMEKVMDIDTAGLGYSSISSTWTENPRVMNSIFRNGLFGRETGHENIGGYRLSSKSPQENWARNLREHKQGHTYFNVVGRTTLENKKRKPNTPEIAGNSLSDDDSVTFYFDLSFFHELNLDTYKNLVKRKGDIYPLLEKNHRYYGVDVNGLYDNNLTRMNLTSIEDVHRVEDIKPVETWGFVTSTRIAPRFFKGIILGDETYESGKGMVSRNPNELQKQVNIYKEKMFNIYKNSPDLFLPIYSTNGNLLWPKQMSYEEVKKFVAERDAKKEMKK